MLTQQEGVLGEAAGERRRGQVPGGRGEDAGGSLEDAVDAGQVPLEEDAQGRSLEDPVDAGLLEGLEAAERSLA